MPIDLARRRIQTACKSPLQAFERTAKVLRDNRDRHWRFNILIHKDESPRNQFGAHRFGVGGPKRLIALMQKERCDIETYDLTAMLPDQGKDQIKGRHGTTAGDPIAVYHKPFLPGIYLRKRL